MNTYFRASCFTLAIMPTCADAGLIGLTVEDISDNSLGLTEYALYAEFDTPTDTLIIIASCAITSTTNFYHSTFNGQASALAWSPAQIAQTNTPDVDSFVTIGAMTGANNYTFLGPGFDSIGFLTGNSIISPGWAYTLDDGFNPGKPDASGKVLIAVLTPKNTPDGKPGVIQGTLEIWYTSNQQGFMSAASFTTAIPAPGAIAVFALSGSRSRRRRWGRMD